MFPAFSPRNTDNPNPFRPALQYLLNGAAPSSRHRGESESSIDTGGGVDSDVEVARPKMSHELRASVYPLISLSRESSPSYERQSRSEIDDESEEIAARGSLLVHNGSEGRAVKSFWLGGGLGRWLFTSSLGWQFHIGFLVLWVGGCGIGLSIMNRIVLLSECSVEMQSHSANIHSKLEYTNSHIL